MFIKNRGKHSVVFVNYNQVKMEGINMFVANIGPSIRVRIRLALVLAGDISNACKCVSYRRYNYTTAEVY